MHIRPGTFAIGVTASLAIGGAALLGNLAEPATAHATTCTKVSEQITRCSDGSQEYVDSAGNRIIKDRHGNIIRKDPPGTAWY